MKKRTKAVALTMVSAMLLLSVSACSGGKNEPSNGNGNTPGDSGPITLTFFDKNTGDLFTNPVAEEITKRTGVKIEIQQPTGDPSEKLNLMLTSNTLPDIVLMDRRSDIVNRYIAAKAIIPLNDLIDQHGPNIKEMYGDVLNKSRHSDGNNYYLNNWYGMDPDPGWSFNMRADILKELGYGDRIESGESFTQEEFVDLLKQFKEKYPQVDGKSSIPLTFNADHMPTVVGTFKAMFGMKSYYESDGQIGLEVREPRYKEMMGFINDLQALALLDNEWAINKTQIFDQKVSSERVFAVGGGEPLEPNRLLREKYGEDTDKQFLAFKVTAPGVDPSATTYGPRSSLGWDAIAITAANKHPEQTIKFMDFLASEEGQYLLMWGLEGEHWEMVDGKHKPFPEVLQGFKDNWNEYSKQTGIRKWTWFVKNGNGSDGTPLDLVAKYERNAYNQHAIKSMKDSTWDTAIYDNLGPGGGTPDALNEQKIKDLLSQGFTQLAYAESKDEFEALYAKLMKDLEDNNAPRIEQIYTENYKKQMELWK
ncbi:extracellular solute-binding protein [Paenibacillus agaridevorans]|uniref:extracellular solute-binding protein n=1 Tax=Paenibacillus agaridevorans TaxID=171404 RepID=UPI001BE47C2E|nr:extracellular solute-binding protein [Paenibacillus agaridevorans]